MGGRFVFANQLRGLAALTVVLVHVSFVAQTARSAVAWVVEAPPLRGPTPDITRWVGDLPIDPAATGVGLFFLISGFVIPFSLVASTPGAFLRARAARIFPTLWVALALEALVVHLSGQHWNRSSPFGADIYLVNGLLLHTVLGFPSVDWVSWTLSIEVKFYLLAALTRRATLRGGLLYPVGCALAALAVNVGAQAGIVHAPPLLVTETNCIAFITVGTMFHAHVTGRLRTRDLALGAMLSLSLVSLCWRYGPDAGDFPGRTKSFAAALAIFAVAYACRHRFRPSRFLDHVASISYPLYLTHAVIGFAMITFLVDAGGLDFAAAAAIALVFCWGVAFAIHRFVERPTMRWGHAMRLRALKPARATPPDPAMPA